MATGDRASLLQELRGMVAERSLSPAACRRVAVLHQQILGRRFVRTACRDCYRDAIILMYNHLNKGFPMADEREFILKRGVVIQHPAGSSHIYTAATLTDAVAREYLRLHPAAARWFERVGAVEAAPAVEATPVEAAIPAADESAIPAVVAKKRRKK